MAARAAFEAMEKYQHGRTGGAVEMIDVDEVAIRCVPTFPAPAAGGGALMSSGHKGLGLAAGQPAGGAIGLHDQASVQGVRMGVGHCLVTVVGCRCMPADQAPAVGAAHIYACDVQWAMRAGIVADKQHLGQVVNGDD